MIGRTIAFLVVATGIGWGVVRLFSAGQDFVTRLEGQWEDQKRAARWEELRKTVVLAGTPLVEKPETSVRDFQAQEARLLALHNSGKLEADNPELVKAWARIETAADTGLLILERIREIDNHKPSGPEILGKIVADDEKTNREFWETLASRLNSEVDKSNLKSEFRKAEQDLNAAIGDLQRMADVLSGRELPNGISVQYWPSWEGTVWGDTFEVQNASDSALQNAVVFTTVHMSDGSSRVHVHYVEQWQSGAWLKAVYPFEAGDYANAETGSHPDNVDVTLYLPSGRVKTSYALTAEEWDKKVGAYCGGLIFSGNYLGAFENSEGRHPPGFQFQFQGLSTLPVASVEVRFTSGSGEIRSGVGYYEPGTKLASGEFHPVRSPQLDSETPDPPSHIDYILRFAGVNYQREVHAY